MFTLNDLNAKNYQILSTKNIEEENLTIVEILHIKTKAKLLLFICDDENRVFNIAFKTPVKNGKGTPHILEHSVLCGSRKYNVKDPFIELAKGSLNTFLNAMTFPDKTCYPVASANLKDFHNLVDVYLDAVFYPNAIKNEKIFRQEGWHYEVKEDKTLTVNGVVYNEMKGVYSDPDSILESAILENLYKGTNYAHDYGGNPSEIINLTYDEFVDFHKKYYSPSNSVIYIYGKLDYNEELDYLNREYLGNFEYTDVDSKYLDVNDFEENSLKVDYYNVDTDDNDDKAYLSYSFAIDEEKTSLDYIVMYILNNVLFTSNAAIIKEKLLNEGIGESVSANLDTSLKHNMYSIVVQNVNENKKDKFIEIFYDCINSIINNGLDVEKFKAAININYFDNAEGEFGRFPRGLFYSLVSMDTYLYGGEAGTYIEYKKTFDYLKSIDLNDKNNIFIKKLKSAFIDNKHKCINILRPKKGYSLEKEQQLADELNRRKQNMSEAELTDIISSEKALKEYQNEKDTKEKLACIPMLDLTDIDKTKKVIDYKLDKVENVDTFIYSDNDKDIIYIDLSFDITSLSKEEMYLFAELSRIIGKIDFKTMSYHEFTNFVGINTGGLDLTREVSEDRLFYTMSIKVTSDKIHEAFEVFFKVLTEVKFTDSKRISILLNEIKSNSLLALLSSGHTATMVRSKSNIEFASSVIDKIDIKGIAYNRFINALCKEYDKNSDLINDTCDLLYKKLDIMKMHLFISANPKYQDKVIDEFKKFLNRYINDKLKFIFTDVDKNRLENNISAIKELIPFDEFEKKVDKEAIITPNDVNFCALSGEFGENNYTGQLKVLTTLFNYEYLWTNIRVLGGAYGCMSNFNRSGFFSLMSYRDPNLSNTNKIFSEVGAFLERINVNEDEVKKYVIGSMGVVDRPLSTVDKFKANKAAYINHMTNDDCDKERIQVLNMKAKDFNDLASIFKNAKHINKCALICASKIEEAKKEYDLVWQLTD